MAGGVKRFDEVREIGPQPRFRAIPSALGFPTDNPARLTQGLRDAPRSFPVE